jgi:hypothetical protein
MYGKCFNKVPNQYVILVDGGQVFQSFDTIIAIVKADGSVILDENMWDCSATTRKYRIKFLKEPTEVTLKKIKAGIYKLENLN